MLEKRLKLGPDNCWKQFLTDTHFQYETVQNTRPVYVPAFLILPKQLVVILSRAPRPQTSGEPIESETKGSDQIIRRW